MKKLHGMAFKIIDKIPNFRKDKEFLIIKMNAK